MKVSDLIDVLEGMDPDLEVGFAYNYGDYWRTKVCKKAASVNELYVQYSEYHNLDKLVGDVYNEEDADYADEVRLMVVIE